MQYKELPPECRKKGFILRKNKIYISFKDYYLSIKQNKKSTYLYTWEIEPNGIKNSVNNAYGITESISKRDFFTTRNKNRDTELINDLMDYDNNIKEENIEKFFKKIKPILNRFKVEDLLDGNYDIKEKFKDFKENEEVKEQYPEKFKDYGKEIQEEAIKLEESDKFYDELLNSVSWKHEGDKKTTELELLSCASLFIKEPVQQILNAKSGKGKTDVTNRVKELLPNQYIVDLVSFSVKSLYYGNKQILHDNYNILVIDDVKFTADIIELLKLLLDNEREQKIHRTVIDGKYLEMELPGYFLGLINRAKDDLDRELSDRCYFNSLSNNKVTNVKNKIKSNASMNVDSVHEKKIKTLQCCWQFLIDKEINVFNFFILFQNFQKHSNRNIKHYISLMKAKTFFNYNKRETIDGITIGSYQDMDEVLNIITEDFQVQKDKLTDLQKRIIDILNNNPEISTNKLLGKELGTSDENIRLAIKGRDNQLGLETLGYIQIETINKGNYSVNKYTVTNDYKVSDNDFIPPTLPTFVCWWEKNHSIANTTILLNFLNYQHILINKRVVYVLKKWVDKKPLIKLDSYKNFCKMINSFNNHIKKCDNIIKTNSETHIPIEDLNYHNNILKNANDEINSYIDNLSKSGSLLEVSKNDKNTLNQNQRKKDHQHQESWWCCPAENLNKDQLEELKPTILGSIQEDNYTTIDELLDIFKIDEDVLFNILLDLAYNENEITIEEKLIPNNSKVESYDLEWVLITTTNPEKVLEKSIKLNAKNKTKKELVKSISNVLPKYDTENSKKEFINDMIERGILETNSKGILSVAKT